MKKDYLKYTDFQIVQDDSLFKINSDTVILGNSLDSLKGKTLLDIGTNNGALLLYGLNKGASFLYGVEIQKQCLKTAKINLSAYTENYKLINDDIRNIEDLKVDAIVCNPPFFEMNNVTPDEKFRYAMFEESLPLEDLFKCYRKLLKDNGEVYMIYPSDRFPELYSMITKYKFKIMKMRYTFDKKSEYSLRVVVKLKIGKMTKTRILKPIMIDKGEINYE